MIITARNCIIACYNSNIGVRILIIACNILIIACRITNMTYKQRVIRNLKAYIPESGKCKICIS